LFSSSRDYAENNALDTYSDTGLNDAEDFGEMSAQARRAAERAMARRDRRESQGRRGARAAARSRAPDFLGSEESEEEGADNGLLSTMKRRARRQYDERVEIDDAEGIEAELPLEQLHDIKANSVAEWIAVDRVRRSIAKYFRQFLISYTDVSGFSVHFPRIRGLGESTFIPTFGLDRFSEF
jgi:DNA replication licensing factor MCM2